MLVVFDIDGTISDPSHRLHLVVPPVECSCDLRDAKIDPKCPRHSFVKDWDAFFEACDGDAPIQAAIDLAGQLSIYNRVECWTGRPERVRAKTERWLFKHLGHSIEKVRMRAEGDRQEDFEVKEDFLYWGTPDVIFEDRQQCVDMWRRHGIYTCQVAVGNY